MAQKNQAPIFAVVALLLFFIATTPRAHGQLELLNSVIVNGSLCCTATGTCHPGARPLVGVKVNLVCKDRGIVGQGVTLENGCYTINVSNVGNTIGSLTSGLGVLPCNVTVVLPLSNTVCPLLSTVKGTLNGVPTFISTLLSAVFGLLGSYTVLSTICLALIPGVTVG